MHAFIKVVVALAAVFLTAGCASLPRCNANAGAKKNRKPPAGVESQHVIEINADGFVLDLRPGKNSAALTDGGRVREYMNATIFPAFAASGKRKIMLFVHGGLDDREAGMQHFWDDYQEIMQGDYYPVFVVWPSGWSSTYFEHLLWVRQGVKPETAGGKAFGLLTSPFMLLADVGRALTRLPLVVANNTRSDIGTVVPVRQREEGAAAVQQFQEMARGGFQVEIGDDYSLNSDRLARGVSYGLTLPIKYFGASLIDGFGQGAWEDMLRRTVETYPVRMDTDAKQRLEAEQTRQRIADTNPGTNAAKRYLSTRQQNLAKRYLAAGLPIFLEALRQRQDSNSVEEVTVVGHSMGTIILNRALRDTGVNITNIVYMGAACSIDDFTTSVLPYLQRHPQAQFYNLSLHPVAEEGEIELADLPPRGSLLVWLDNFLAHPVTEQERMFGRWENLFRSSATGEPMIRTFYANDQSGTLRSRLHFQSFSVGFGGINQLRKLPCQWNQDPKAVDISQRCDTPLKHGDFTEMPYWLPGFWWKPAEAAAGMR